MKSKKCYVDTLDSNYLCIKRGLFSFSWHISGRCKLRPVFNILCKFRLGYILYTYVNCAQGLFCVRSKYFHSYYLDIFTKPIFSFPVFRLRTVNIILINIVGFYYKMVLLFMSNCQFMLYYYIKKRII